MDFNLFVTKTRESRKTPMIDDQQITLCFDPGHTTGFAVFHGTDLFESGEVRTEPIEVGVREIERLISSYEPDIVVMEDYRVYQWKTKQHGGSELLTTRVIGCIETFCVINFIIHIVKQPAHTAKGFCTDAKLRAWGFYKKGERHARDAIRHGCYFLLFGAIDPKQNTSKSQTVG